MKVELYRMRKKSDVAKHSPLSEAQLVLERLDLTYDEYLTPALLWVDKSAKKIASSLGVDKVIPKGLYIMGILGGERRTGKENYAGLILEKFWDNGTFVRFRLHNTSKDLEIPKHLMDRYGVEVFNLIYRGLINPFCSERFRILLSRQGKKKLVGFLKKTVELCMQTLTESDRNKIMGLIREVRQPSKLASLNVKKNYVVYRCNRAFTAFFLKPPPNTIIESHVSAMECTNKEQAHYYTAALNYLAFKVIETGRTFIRDQFARPLAAIILAGISWTDMDEKSRKSIATLSERLSMKIRWKKYTDQKIALKKISETIEFAKIVKTLDAKIESPNLLAALRMVSGESRRCKNSMGKF